jgi:catechol 2,3-dioxygenase-like lactoylglutathione lyase family enzyme
VRYLSDTVDVRCIVDDVDSAANFYTKYFGFTLEITASPAFADVVRGLAASASKRPDVFGRASHAGRSEAGPGGWNRIEFVVDDIGAEVERLRDAGVRFRNDIVAGPGGSSPPVT